MVERQSDGESWQPNGKSNDDKWGERDPEGDREKDGVMISVVCRIVLYNLAI